MSIVIKPASWAKKVTTDLACKVTTDLAWEEVPLGPY